MFNRRRKQQRRIDAATPAVRRPRWRRLAVETMESRLLLTGNQLTGGDIDDSIYNLDSIAPNPYVVISQGDVAAPTITDNDSNPAVDVPSTNALAPSNLVKQYFVTGPGYVDTGYGTQTSVLLYYGEIRGGGELTSLVDNNFDRNSFFDPILDADATPLDRSIGLKSLELRWAARMVRSSNATNFVFDAVGPNLASDSLSNRLVLNSGFEAGFTGSTVYAAIVPEVRLPLAELVVEAKPIDTSLSAPTVAPLVKSDFSPVAPAPKTPSDNANIAASKVESVLEAPAGNTSAIRIPVVPADVIPALRQPTREERLADAIDDLLSGDAIIISPVGESGTEYVVSDAPTGLDAASDFTGGPSESEFVASAPPLTDGGMIPIDVLVAASSDVDSITVDSAAELAATDGSNGGLGELSRVAVMELIEGEAEPGAAEASDHVMVVADNDSNPLDAFRVVAEQAGTALALASPTGPTYAASIATAVVDAASRAMATLVGSHLAADVADEVGSADVARQAAFSELGGAADETDSIAATDGPHWNEWLAAAPLALVIAGERALAARRKRQEQRDPARPRTAK